jgi:60S ribosome subunit biogenesis protein NIP7
VSHAAFLFSEMIWKRAQNVARENLASVGVCFGKFTKTGKFTLHITSLDFLAQYARFKIWLKPTSEMSFLYGNHILKAHIAKMTEDVPEHQGVVVYSSADVALGFATTAKSAALCSKLDPTAIAAYHQADVGEYLRDEDTLI